MLKVAARMRRGAFALDAHFELPTPGVVALFGRSGCGKTTLVNVIAGLLSADSARIALDDELLLDSERRINVPPEHRRIGYVFQEARLFPHLSVAGNLRYAEKRAVAPRFVGLDEIAALLDLDALLRKAHSPALGRRTAAGGHRPRTVVPAEAFAAR